MITKSASIVSSGAVRWTPEGQSGAGEGEVQRALDQTCMCVSWLAHTPLLQFAEQTAARGLAQVAPPANTTRGDMFPLPARSVPRAVNQHLRKEMQPLTDITKYFIVVLEY
uniref:Uncharacterized protein n=1 Tax=Heliothis virescens TaxID=7102 RepID=A0A2A4IZH4_HELVI